MKGKIVCTIALLSCVICQAQTNNKKIKHQQNSISTHVDNSNTFSTVSVGSYEARSDSFGGTRPFSIADPTILALNANANGGDMRISNSGIVGMPKRAYGF